MPKCPKCKAHWMGKCHTTIFNSLVFGYTMTTCTIGQIPHLLWLGVKFPALAVVPKVKCPAPRGRGVKCSLYVQGEGD